MSFERIYYDYQKDVEVQNAMIDDAVSFIRSLECYDENDTRYTDKIKTIIDMYNCRLFYNSRIVTAITLTIDKYNLGMIQLLRNINAPCLMTQKSTDSKLLTELLKFDVLKTISIDYTTFVDVNFTRMVWDDDIITACEKHGEDFYIQLSYYKKGEVRDSSFINWCLNTININNQENTIDFLYIKGLPVNIPLVRAINGAINKETAFYKSDSLKEYYFYKVLGINKNSIKNLHYEQLQTPKGNIIHYTLIKMKKYREIKEITTNIDNPNLKYGVINDKLLIKYVLKRLQSLFNRSIIHGDIKVANILISKRTKNKCIIIDYEHSFDLKDKYFQHHAKAYMVSANKSTLSYKSYHGQILSDKIYSYKADIVNLIYSVVSYLFYYDYDLSTLQKIKAFNNYISNHKFYSDLISIVDSYSEDEISNETYHKLIEITNYHIMTTYLNA